MTKYNRVTGKVFGATASATGDNPEIGQFGSAKEGSYIGTSDISTIQALPAWGQGWAGAVTPETNFPPLPEMTGAMKVLSQQQCYLLQQGLAEWDSATIYYTNNFSAKNGKIYISLTNENQGNDPKTDKVNWKEFSAGGGLEICDIGMALYVDETKGLRRYLNGQVVDINTNTQAFLNRLKEITTLHPSLLCTEEEWQTAKTMSAFGQVGKFVFNYSGEEIVSVRLPRVVNVQGLFDLQNLGMAVAESLPNIKGGFGGLNTNTYGAFEFETVTYKRSGGDVKTGGGVNFDASRSSSTYQDGAPVQQEAIQYPYFIQIATGSETENNIVNGIELNNPYSLFDSKYSDHELNNLSWLKSEGQWNSKATYPNAYDKLLKVYNGTETVEGLSVKLSTETYTDYDFVLNTADETFRLPLKTKLASGKAVVGNGMTLGLQNGSKSVGFVGLGSNSAGSVGVLKSFYGEELNSAIGNALNYTPQIINTGITTDPTKSGIETSDSGLYLYFYVGETVQNANLIDAGRIGESLANKVDIDLSNLSADGKEYASGLSMPDFTRMELKNLDTRYQAECDGYVYMSGVLNNSIHYNIRFSLDGTFTDFPFPNMGNAVCSLGPEFQAQLRKAIFIPCPKGIYYKGSVGSSTLTSFYFIKAKGAK